MTGSAFRFPANHCISPTAEALKRTVMGNYLQNLSLKATFGALCRTFAWGNHSQFVLPKAFNSRQCGTCAWGSDPRTLNSQYRHCFLQSISPKEVLVQNAIHWPCYETVGAVSPDELDSFSGYFIRNFGNLKAY